jgi:hypothetical protein
MPVKVHLIFSGFLIIAAVFLVGGVLAVPEIMSGRSDLLSKRSAAILETCTGMGFLFLFGTIGSLLSRVHVLEREVEKLKSEKTDN